MKLSPTRRVILCELNLVNNIYNTIAQNNRSLPWMKVCQQACNILITLSKHLHTRKYVLKVGLEEANGDYLPSANVFNISLKKKNTLC